MQTVYATHLPLLDASGHESAKHVLAQWVQARFGVDLDPLSGGERRNPDDVKVRWQGLSSEGRELLSTTIEQTDRKDAAWRWRTYVDLGVEGPSAWVRTRVHLYSPLEGRLTR